MHCPYFICERRFYVRPYASENYATMEINPKAAPRFSFGYFLMQRLLLGINYVAINKDFDPEKLYRATLSLRFNSHSPEVNF